MSLLALSLNLHSGRTALFAKIALFCWRFGGALLRAPYVRKKERKIRFSRGDGFAYPTRTLSAEEEAIRFSARDPTDSAHFNTASRNSANLVSSRQQLGNRFVLSLLLPYIYIFIPFLLHFIAVSPTRDPYKIYASYG